jgi:nitrite reductase/ring-hydroxylating ferredoxin subunit
MVLNLMPRRWWKSLPTTGEPVDVASAGELARHGRLVVTHPELGTAVLLVSTRRGVFAVENRCPHRGARLDDGTVDGRTITCAMHGRRFDLRSGRCSGGAAAALRTWPAWVAGGRVLVRMVSPPA